MQDSNPAALLHWAENEDVMIAEMNKFLLELQCPSSVEWHMIQALISSGNWGQGRVFPRFIHVVIAEKYIKMSLLYQNICVADHMPSDDPFPGICVNNALKSRVYSCTEPVCLRRSSRSRALSACPTAKIPPYASTDPNYVGQSLQRLWAFVPTLDWLSWVARQFEDD